MLDVEYVPAKWCGQEAESTMQCKARCFVPDRTIWLLHKLQVTMEQIASVSSASATTATSSAPASAPEEEQMLSSLEWTNEEVIAFMDAIIADGRCLLPIGVNKHFNMISISRRFQIATKKKVDTAVFWDWLNDYYDMAKLETIVQCPFPNEQIEFSLPENDFSQLIRDRKGQSAQDKDKIFDEESRDSGSGRETPPTLPIAKRGASIQSALASSASKRKYSSSFSETGSESGVATSGRKSTSGSGTSASGVPPKVKRRI